MIIIRECLNCSNSSQTAINRLSDVLLGMFDMIIDITFNFEELIEEQHLKFIELPSVKEFLLNNPESSFYMLCEAFWKNPAIDENQLRERFRVPDSIPIIKILNSYKTETYINFLRDSWDRRNTIDFIIKIPCAKGTNL